jgi:hypothetical protein
MGRSGPRLLPPAHAAPPLPEAGFGGMEGGAPPPQGCVRDRDRRLGGARAVAPEGARRAPLAAGRWPWAAGPPPRVAVAMAGPRGAMVAGLGAPGCHVWAMPPSHGSGSGIVPVVREPQMTGALPVSVRPPAVPSGPVGVGSPWRPRTGDGDERAVEGQQRGAQRAAGGPSGSGRRGTGWIPSGASGARRPWRRGRAAPLPAWRPPGSARRRTRAGAPGEGERPSAVARGPSRPGVGRPMTAGRCAAAAPPLAARDAQVWRTPGGGAPGTQHSGKRRQGGRRHGCHPRWR